MDALTQNWIVRKPPVASQRGIVASQNGVAAKVGAEILDERVITGGRQVSFMPNLLGDLAVFRFRRR